ncbi:MAG TPA: putative sulfate exporter family transporter [Polyangiaceae bacterium]
MQLASSHPNLSPSGVRVALAIAGGLLCLGPADNAGVALVLGAAIGVLVGNPAPALTKKLAHHVLFGAVAGLGAGLSLKTLLDVGAQGIGGTVLGIVLCLSLGALFARVLKLETKLALLVTVGTAICGGSAIAAIAPVVRAKDDESSIALATVFLLNGIALFLFPAVGHLFHMSGHQFGWWSAIAIHDTSSVVGAAMRFGDGAVDLAVPLKLTRALYIVPVAVLVSALLPRIEGKKDASGGAVKVPWPWLAIAFLAVSTLFTFAPLDSVRPHVVSIARRGMVIALYLVGMGLTRATLKKVSGKALLFGTTLWIVMGTVTLIAVRLFVAV